MTLPLKQSCPPMEAKSVAQLPAGAAASVTAQSFCAGVRIRSRRSVRLNNCKVEPAKKMNPQKRLTRNSNWDIRSRVFKVFRLVLRACDSRIPSEPVLKAYSAYQPRKSNAYQP